MCDVPIPVQVLSTLKLPVNGNKSDDSSTNGHQAFKNDVSEQRTPDSNTNTAKKKTPRGPAPTPPPKPRDLAKRGISMSATIITSSAQTNCDINNEESQLNGKTLNDEHSNDGKSRNSPSTYHPVPPPKPRKLLLQNLAQSSITSVKQSSTNQNVINDEAKDTVNENSVHKPLENRPGGDGTTLDGTDENANVQNTNAHGLTSNSLTNDSHRDLTTCDNDHEKEPASNSSHDSSSSLSSSDSSLTSKLVTRETTSSTKTFISSSSTEYKGTIGHSMATNNGPGLPNSLSRHTSNVEKMSRHFSSVDIQRSFSARYQMDTNVSRPILSSQKKIQSAKSTVSVDSDDSSDEMDVSIELSVQLQKELRQFLQKRKLNASKNQAEVKVTSSTSKDQNSKSEQVVHRQYIQESLKGPLSPSSSKTQPPTKSDSDQLDSSCVEESEAIPSDDLDNNGIHEGGESVGLDPEEVKRRKKQQKLYFIAKEITSSEFDFVDKLHLLNTEFRQVAEKHLSSETIRSELHLFNYLPQLTSLNENLLSELQKALNSWPVTHKIAHVLVKIGPFLKQYSEFIKEFDRLSNELEEALRKYPAFSAAVKEFEATPRCGKLMIKHFLLKPIQRIPQYRLLLHDYSRNLPEGHPDEQDTLKALKIVSDVAEHANNTMKQCENFVKMKAIQNSLLGSHEVIKPGRMLLKTGDMFKRSRRNLQPRRFVLCSDCLLYMTLLQTGSYRLNHEITLAGMRVILPQQYDFKSELTIRSPKRSFTIVANDEVERDAWFDAITRAIQEHNCKRYTLSNSLSLPTETSNGSSRPSSSGSSDPALSNVNLGDEQPVWIPDSRVTMCQLCTAGFSLTFRRHHCRACGQVVCEACSGNIAPLKYLSYRTDRVCDGCYPILMNNVIEKKERKKSMNGNDPGSETGSISSQTFEEVTPVENDDEPDEETLLGSFVRKPCDPLRASKRIPNIPKIRKVLANDPTAEMSGYLLFRETVKKKNRWKRYWFMLKEEDTDIKILYKFKESEDVAALDSVPLLGWDVGTINGALDGHPASLLFQLTHPGCPSYVFKADDEQSKERWIKVMQTTIEV